MCGIVGFFGAGNSRDLEILTRLLSHRGPDAEGFYLDDRPGVFLGHRRLAIRDIVGGTQPMASADGRFVMVYNGELYNDRELKLALELQGHSFRTESDTEVLLRALIEWRTEILARIDGQFAFCFVDLETGDVVLARDRFGEKPLFWSMQAGGFLFSSESSVLAQHPWVTPELDEESCELFLLLGYLPPPHSILKGIQQVRPGHAVRFNFKTRGGVEHFSFARPWDVWVDESVSSIDASELKVEHLDEAVSTRRISDVPVGVLLSGGLDSSLVAACAVRTGWTPKSFTIGFGSDSYDESRGAQQTAKGLGIRNRTLLLEEWSSERVTQVLQTLDEPLGDSSYLPTYEVFNMASEDVKVLLSGDGADELLFGYEPFRASILAERVGKVVPKVISRTLGNILRRVPRRQSYMNRIDVAERFFDGLSRNSVRRVLLWMCTLRSYEWGKFFREPPDEQTLFRGLDEIEASGDTLEDIRRFFLSWYLPGSIFAKSDTGAMANGVEARTVYLSPKFVNFAMRRSSNHELTGGLGKHSLREVARKLGLKSVADRKKHGFALPVADVLRVCSLPQPRIQLSTIDQAAVDRAWDAAKSGEVRYSAFLWAALSLVNCRAYRVAIDSQSRD